MNSMKRIRIEKVTLNIGTTTDKEKLERAAKLLEKISGRKPIITKTRKRNTFGIARGRPIGVKITLRGKAAEEMLMSVLKSVKNTLKSSQINGGNFSIGVKEYIDLPGVKYDPNIGVLGFDCCVTLERPGYRVKKRKIKTARIGKRHLITKEETIEWVKALGVKIVD